MKKNAELSELTFPTSGITVHLPLMSAAGLAMRLRRKYPAPNPPIQVVDYGNGHKEKEFNYSHPEYKEAQRLHALFINQKTEEILMERAVRSLSLSPEQKEMVAQWKTENPGWYDEDDKDQAIFFEEFCLADEDDLLAFIKHISGYDPTEEEIASAVAGFPGNVS